MLNASENLYTDTSATQAEAHFARVIAISSGKGGVGKSTLATNLGIALSDAGKKVCLFDADTNLANINILLGITPLHTLEHFFKNDLSIDDVLTQGPGGIDIVCGASGLTDFIQFSQAQQHKLTQGIKSLEKNNDYILIDTAAGIDETNISLILAAPYLLLVITSEPTSLTDAFSLLRVLKKYHFEQPILVIVNMTANRQDAQATFKRFKMAVNKYLQFKQVHLAGYVLNDRKISLSIIKQQAVLLSYPDTSASQCIRQICERLLTVFDKNKQMSTPFSDYFSDLALPDDIDGYIEDDNEPEKAFVPAAIMQDHNESQTIVLKNEQPLKNISQNDSLQTSLLQASHYARLLGQNLK